MLSYAELCAGVGGLGLAVEQTTGARLAWYSEFDPAPSRVMAARWPGVPNHGDMTRINWTHVEPVDIIAGGTPCQDVSQAGARRGMTEGTRSNLWTAMADSIATIRPRLVIWENVQGAFSARADSLLAFMTGETNADTTGHLEPCPGCVGDPQHGVPVLRALGRVLGDLSTLGYDTQWRTVRASDVGAPHQRARVFVLAHRRDTADADGSGLGSLRGSNAA